MAARHFRRAAQFAPDDPVAWDQLGRTHAHLSHWPEAIECFGKAVGRNPDYIEYWYHHAVAHAGAGDLEAYRRICAEMAHRFRDTKDSSVASRIVYGCVADQNAGPDGEELVRLAVIGVPWFRGNIRVHGAALYRAGQYEEALSRFDELDTLIPSKAWDWLFRSMAHARLNQHDKARQCLERAVLLIEEADRLDVGDAPNRWYDWFEKVEVRRLLREAEDLSKTASKKKPKRPAEQTPFESESDR
jgi:tetratricopeptide (TPR) repeat protein